jgi:predicted metal-dependent phosphoesterase TrpH
MSIAGIVKLAKALGLDSIAITDHDTFSGREEALTEGKKQGLPIIPGIEISAFSFSSGRKVHILGYGVKTRIPCTRPAPATLRTATGRTLKRRGSRNRRGIP